MIQVSNSEDDMKETLDFCIALKTLKKRNEEITSHFKAIRTYKRQRLPNLEVSAIQLIKVKTREMKLNKTFCTRKVKRTYSKVLYFHLSEIFPR